MAITVVAAITVIIAARLAQITLIGAARLGDFAAIVGTAQRALIIPAGIADIATIIRSRVVAVVPAMGGSRGGGDGGGRRQGRGKAAARPIAIISLRMSTSPQVRWQDWEKWTERVLYRPVIGR